MSKDTKLSHCCAGAVGSQRVAQAMAAWPEEETTMEQSVDATNAESGGQTWQ